MCDTGGRGERENSRLVFELNTQTGRIAQGLRARTLEPAVWL